MDVSCSLLVVFMEETEFDNQVHAEIVMMNLGLYFLKKQAQFLFSPISFWTDTPVYNLLYWVMPTGRLFMKTENIKYVSVSCFV